VKDDISGDSMSTPTNESPTDPLRETPKNERSSFHVASAMLRIDASRLLLFLALLLGDTVLISLGLLDDNSVEAFILQFVLRISFLFLFASRWLKIFSEHYGALTPQLRFMRLFAAEGLMTAAALLFVIPLYSQQPAVLVVFLAFLAGWLFLRMYFMFVVILVHSGAFVDSIRAAWHFTEGRSFLAMRAITGPAGIALLVWALIVSTGVDVHASSWDYVRQFSMALFTIAATANALALGVVNAPATFSLTYINAPNIQYKLKALAAEQWTLLSKLLSVRGGMVCLALAVPLLTANYIKSFNAPPPFQIEVIEQSYTTDQKIQIRVVSSALESTPLDRMQINAFRLATEDGRHFALLASHDLEPTALAPDGTAHRYATLVFPSERAIESLAPLKGIWLWYRGFQVQEMKFKAVGE
jgi:type 1 fimbria pilin